MHRCPTTSTSSGPARSTSCARPTQRLDAHRPADPAPDRAAGLRRGAELCATRWSCSPTSRSASQRAASWRCSSRGINFSISAAMGFISIFGIAIQDGLLVVSYAQRLRAAGHPWPEAIELASQRRLRPVLMTTLVAMLGLIPAALSHGHRLADPEAAGGGGDRRRADAGDPAAAGAAGPAALDPPRRVRNARPAAREPTAMLGLTAMLATLPIALSCSAPATDGARARRSRARSPSPQAEEIFLRTGSTCSSPKPRRAAPRATCARRARIRTPGSTATSCSARAAADIAGRHRPHARADPRPVVRASPTTPPSRTSSSGKHGLRIEAAAKALAAAQQSVAT